MSPAKPGLLVALGLGLLVWTPDPATAGPPNTQEQEATREQGTTDEQGTTEEQETAEPQEPELDVAFTVYARELPTAPQAVTVIDRRSIEASGARTVGELLRTVAGVHPLDTGLRGGSNAALIRGGDPNFTVVLVDGVPVNDATDQLGGAVNLETFPVGAVEKVEVVRGPMSFFYGSAALGGVVNVVTRRGGGDEPLVELEIGAGNASLWQGSAVVAGAEGHADYALGVQFEAEEGRIADDDFEDLQAHGKLGVALGERSELLISSRLSRWAADDYPETSGGPELGSGELRHSDVDALTLAAELRFATDPLRAHKLAGYYFRRSLERESPAILPLVPPSTERTTYQRLRLAAATTLWASSDARLVGGLDVDHERGDSASRLRLAPGPGGDLPAGYSLSRTTPAGYVELSAGRGGLLVEAGLRVDAADASAAPGAAAASDGPAADDGSPASGGRDVEWTPRLGIGYRFADGRTRLRSTAGRAFKLPSFFALGSPPPLGGNPGLEPETGVGVDAGIEHAVPDLGLELDASVFYSRYGDLIDFDFETFRLVNRAEVESLGAELAADWQPTPALSAAATVTWNRVENLTGPEPLLHRPAWLASGRLTWRPDPSFDVWTDLRLVSESLDRQLPVPDRDIVDGYGLLGLAATWRPRNPWRLQLRVDNLADTDYEHFIGFPGPGRSVVASLGYEVR